jgi:Arc/MetJ family transcription regulator
VRTNIDIDDQLIAEAQQLTGLKTKREVVDAALRMLIRIERANILDLGGKVQWEGNLDESRKGRSPP